MKGIVVIWTVLLMGFSAGISNGQALPWSSIAHLGDSLRAKPKPLMVFIYTDWCKYCKMQENITFKDSEVIDLLAKKFYCLKIDAEDEKNLAFMGRNYDPGSEGDFHPLARMLGMEKGKLLFPTTVFYSPLDQYFQIFQGFQRTKDLKRFIQEMNDGKR
ncbi:thioredoxin family protein [uncultured Cyclobacterium sp.]|mgnify:CR=1 FL=1|uniref:thioredoxin family protein n=1 Tax=uncultured Cyclobacterium sp. TaxID=453820 RepID=UPI0030EF5A34|tara:strand:- start:221219 stop:221695 length:477 start_codon:yes stop_codon:yes gene_type:complete